MAATRTGDGELDVTETWTYSATYAVTQGDIDAGGVDNLATADSDESDPASDPETVDIDQVAEIDIVKDGVLDDGGDGVVNVGDEIDYTFTVTNEGNVSLTNVSVTDPLPGLSTITFDGGDTDGDGELDVTETWTYSATYAVTQGDIDAGGVDNLATADSDESDPASDPETVDIAADPAIAIDKRVVGIDTAGNGVIDNPNEVIDYEIRGHQRGQCQPDQRGGRGSADRRRSVDPCQRR